jgi:hypothetical protein
MEDNYVWYKPKVGWYKNGEKVPFNPRFIPALIEKKKNKHLSGVCSALYALRRGEDSIAEDMRAFGAPSECYADAYRGYERRRQEIIEESGFLCEEVLRGVINLRVSHKWLYFSGIL